MFPLLSPSYNLIVTFVNHVPQCFQCSDPFKLNISNICGTCSHVFPVF